MALSNPYYIPNASAFGQTTPMPPYYQGPQSYVNFQMPSPTAPQNGVFTRFVSNEQEAASMPNPVSGCAFFVDGENLILYAKYADGRPMEVYDMKLREAEKPAQYLTVDEFNKIMNEKMDEISKKFVIRKERYNNNG